MYHSFVVVVVVIRSHIGGHGVILFPCCYETGTTSIDMKVSLRYNKGSFAYIPISAIAGS